MYHHRASLLVFLATSLPWNPRGTSLVGSESGLNQVIQVLLVKLENGSVKQDLQAISSGVWMLVNIAGGEIDNEPEGSMILPALFNKYNERVLGERREECKAEAQLVDNG
ncbi:hypothetical protein P692DRAFT_201810198 [Suillus brevipes Sb2]|nr:hypothetical protein P692DRAFT_201810198 [Suillus brevipes Sb2]